MNKEDIVNEGLHRAGQRRKTQLSNEDKAVLSVMSDYPLKPGQMLLFGPISVKILAGGIEFKGKLPDKYVLEKSEWNNSR